MRHNWDVISFGEIIVDFFPERTGQPLRKTRRFSMNQGGAPANVSVGVTRLGGRCAMMGAVGADEFGAFLIETLAAEGVGTGTIVEIADAITAITFVAVDSNGDRSFHFFRTNTADLQFSTGHLDHPLMADTFANARIFHFGSNLLCSALSLEATNKAIDMARAAGCLVSSDPNMRLHLWKKCDLAIDRVHEFLERVDLVKVSDEENALLAPGLSPRQAFDQVYGPKGISVVLFTHGPDGATAVTRDFETHQPAPAVNVIDTTGAGDGFVSGVLTALLRCLGEGTADGPSAEETQPANLLTALGAEEWNDILSVGNRAGAFVCTKMGATTALPYRKDIFDGTALG